MMLQINKKRMKIHKYVQIKNHSTKPHNGGKNSSLLQKMQKQLDNHIQVVELLA
jgi:hypothetical protein